MIEFLQALIFFSIILGFYFTPTFVASYTNHRQARAIFVLNLLLGWTFIGWAAALIWAVLKD